MNRKFVAVSAAACALIAGTALTSCGKQPASTAAPPPTPVPAPLSLPPSPKPNQQAYNCSKIHPASAPPGSPVDDILGVRPGLLPDEAKAILTCEHLPYTIDSEDNNGGNFGIPPYPDGTSAKNGFTASRDDGSGVTDKIVVSYVGLPGQERVATVQRLMDYPAGKQPSIQSIRDNLIAKYGMPNHNINRGNDLGWVRYPDGSLISDNTIKMYQCTANVGHGGISITSGCGLTVVASIMPSGDNPAAAMHFDISLADQAPTFAVITKAKAYVQGLRGSGGTAPTM